MAHLRGAGAPVSDAAGDTALAAAAGSPAEAARAVVTLLGADLGTDDALVAELARQPADG
jgi:hypothetical protein